MSTKTLKKRYGPYRHNHGYVIYIDVYADGTRKTVLDHREKMEKKLRIKLSHDLIVHHKNGVRADNEMHNLEVMHEIDHARHHARTKEIFAFTCPQCGQYATKEMRNVRGNSKKGRAGPFCSRQCAGKYRR